MAEYRKKPVVVDAIENKGDWGEITEWLDEFETNEPVPLTLLEDGTVLIQAQGGLVHADLGDYIIRGVKGEFYPCKPDIFKMTHEEA